MLARVLPDMRKQEEEIQQTEGWRIRKNQSRINKQWRVTILYTVQFTCGTATVIGDYILMANTPDQPVINARGNRNSSVSLFTIYLMFKGYQIKQYQIHV